MKKFMLLGLISGALAGCVSEYSGPVSGVIGPERAQGQFTAKLDGAGTFFVLTTRGLRCEGTYDSLSRQPTITADVACNDGRTGTMILTRSMNQLSGTAIGRLNDGTQGQFVFGDITFDQAFGDGGGAATR
ncbi:hypothetical protein [Marinovum algicola]|uniref:hypothetical protein n=1 Tax=Marinovum algicola TaxID=42444 RepID=UPI003529D572